MLIEDQVQSWLLAKQLAGDERVTKNAGGILAAWTAFCTSSLIIYYFSAIAHQPQIIDGQSEWSKTDVDTLWEMCQKTPPREARLAPCGWG